MVIQRRIDSSLSFNQSWDKYVHGFGDTNGSLWVGLAEQHRMTTMFATRLQFDIEPFDLPMFSMFYESFEIGDAAANFRLLISGFSYSSSYFEVRDGLNIHNNMLFTTYDRDNDNRDGRNCAEIHSGGWWYSNCMNMNLNGIYYGPSHCDVRGITIRYINTTDRAECRPIRYVVMKIRAV